MPPTYDRYGADPLAGPADSRRSGSWRRPRPVPDVAAEEGLVVEDAETGWCGAVVSADKQAVVLEDRRGARKSFGYGAGFLLDGAPVALVRPVRAAAAGPRVTASGSIAVQGLTARVARASRIWVEGVHDAELVEKVWGHDLRVEGVVIEPLHGIDDLAAAVRGFAPGPGRRLGVLVDHLVPGSKESRLAAEVSGPHVRVLGHPYVDVWQAVRPSALGIAAWPEVPRGKPWKEGVCAGLGWPHRTPDDLREAWRRILGAVSSYADLEPALLGRVEELIDFTTAPDDLNR